MTKFRVAVMVLAVALAVLAFPSVLMGDDWDKKTEVTFNVPVEVPGVGAQVLPAGTYVFKLLYSIANRHVVQILNPSQDHVYATILAVPNYRLKATSKTVMTFRERAVGEPQAIRAWFYPGDRFGQEFVYPKTRAIELAKLVEEPVLAMPTEVAAKFAVPIKTADDPVILAVKEVPLEAVKPSGEVVPIAEVVDPLPARTELAQNLPRVASQMPLVGLIGLLLLVTGAALSFILKRVV